MIPHICPRFVFWTPDNDMQCITDSSNHLSSVHMTSHFVEICLIHIFGIRPPADPLPSPTANYPMNSLSTKYFEIVS